MIDLVGKTALVTGAGSGIGAATAQLFAQWGAFVWVADVDAQASAKVAAGIASSASLLLDVTIEADWDAAIERIQSDPKGFDILVNAAGIGRAGGDQMIGRAALTDWRRVFAVNVEGTLLGCQHAMRAMTKRGGAIVNISSTTALVPTATLGAYGASKAAVLQLTKSIAAACAIDALPIRCNAVLPGMVDTAMTAAMTPVYRQNWESQIPAGRFAEPAEIASAIAFLSSDSASYINGTGLLVDGGFVNRPPLQGR